MMLYACVMARDKSHDGWQSSEHLPMFFLDSWIQGIVDCEHAGRIACSIVGEGARVVDVQVAEYQNREEE